MTVRLYYNAPYQREFDSTIIDIVETDGKQALMLAQSCFYPTSGGQPFDMGQLALAGTDSVLNVVDVIAGDAKQEAGQPVLHVLQPTTLALERGMAVHGVIDWQRRYDHMQQHSSQHLLSHVLDSAFGYETVSVHFGASESTIDLQPSPSLNPTKKAQSLSVEQIAELEQHVSELVYRNMPITAYFVDDEQLSALPLRRPPKVAGKIRIVEIAKLDYSACGGTHCRHTGELGPIKIVKQERQRGNIRLTFLSGHRALKDYAHKHTIASDVATLFSNEIAQVPTLVEGLLEQNRMLEKELAAQTRQLLHGQAQELWQKAMPVGPFRLIVEKLTEMEVNEAKQLASILQEHAESIIVLVVIRGEKLTAIFARGSEPTLNMGNLLRSTLAELGGGGGGKEDFAQGGGLAASKASALMVAAVEQIQASAGPSI